MIIIFATLAQSLVSDSYSINVVGLIIFWRVIMGIGIGYVKITAELIGIGY